MNQNCLKLTKKLANISCFLISAIIPFSSRYKFVLPASAQLTPDNTLGAENSLVKPQNLRDLIKGGAKRGNNLFHSFSEFNINNGQQVYLTA